jgi:hypothetical protein
MQYFEVGAIEETLHTMPRNTVQQKILKNEVIRAVCQGLHDPVRWILQWATRLHSIISQTTKLFIIPAVRI